MRLKKVIHRKPVPFQVSENAPNYLLCYVVETLECGHTVTTYPQVDPLIAVRRDCKDCGSVLQFPVGRKKNPRADDEEKKAA